jgi:hypothetical protein
MNFEAATGVAPVPTPVESFRPPVEGEQIAEGWKRSEESAAPVPEPIESTRPPVEGEQIAEGW